MSADQVRRALAEVCGYHDGPDCQHCADTYAHAQLHKGMSDDEILADIQLYRSDFRTWEAKVRAAGRRQAADAIRATHDTWSQLGKLPQSYLDGVADAAGIVDCAPAEPIEEGTDAHTS